MTGHRWGTSLKTKIVLPVADLNINDLCLQHLPSSSNTQNEIFFAWVKHEEQTFLENVVPHIRTGFPWNKGRFGSIPKVCGINSRSCRISISIFYNHLGYFKKLKYFQFAFVYHYVSEIFIKE